MIAPARNIPRQELDDNESAMDSKALPNLRMRKNTLADIRDPLGLRPSAVELYSRLVFPLAFAAFHVGYWLTCWACLDRLPEDAVKFTAEDFAK